MLVHGDWFLVLDICSHGRAINAKGLPANNVDPFPVRVVPLTNENREPPSDPTWSLVRRGPGVRGSAPGSEEVKARDKGAADSPVCFPDPHTWRGQGPPAAETPVLGSESRALDRSGPRTRAAFVDDAAQALTGTGLLVHLQCRGGFLASRESSWWLGSRMKPLSVRDAVFLNLNKSGLARLYVSVFSCSIAKLSEPFLLEMERDPNRAAWERGEIRG
ncbi:uncharacterized protein B0H64DRAFT_373168 [Chaetomium fimeti]|uniref:Uncharacterized protein n=1 Tax=Chaetomium fimeti TaxID=1854472 RepID=A0AAE0HJT6_9PEZI|nr:hypothetical protein B0H64DRAFT_373168 [Chaetomium fimeti]